MYRQNFENYIEEVRNQTNESYQQQLEAEQYEPPKVENGRFLDMDYYQIIRHKKEKRSNRFSFYI